MTYKLLFKASAWKEWQKLDAGIRNQFKTKLMERLAAPHAPAAHLSGMSNAYKIKLRSSGYRLVYTVEDTVLTVEVVAVGRRDKNEVYRVALSRLQND